MEKPAINYSRSALIVAHGSPSDPQVQEEALRELAIRVKRYLPGWRVGSATLAVKGSVERNAQKLGEPLVYPYFMAEGWFTNKILKEKTTVLGLKQLRPFGVEETLLATVASLISKTTHSLGWDTADTTVLIAAHGSKVSRTSADSAYSFRKALSKRVKLRNCVCGFVEEPPFLEDIANGLGQAICLPFFAINAGHVVDDLPLALKAARFEGPVLQPFIFYPETAVLIADSLRQYAGNELHREIVFA